MSLREDEARVAVTLLVIPHCPHAEPAAALVRAALDEIGRQEVDVITHVVDADSTPSSFGGSPTFVVAGADLFPTSVGTAGLSCRLYANEGASAGLPAAADLREALTRSLPAPGVEGGASRPE
ncbi:MAG TPA: hypothetical protein VNB94_14055 [Mycobacteriales bacterium]|nr:hypothetical protein [Mycobacteriales bacterium]